MNKKEWKSFKWNYDVQSKSKDNELITYAVRNRWEGGGNC